MRTPNFLSTVIIFYISRGLHENKVVFCFIYEHWYICECFAVNIPHTNPEQRIKLLPSTLQDPSRIKISIRMVLRKNPKDPKCTNRERNLCRLHQDKINHYSRSFISDKILKNQIVNRLHFPAKKSIRLFSIPVHISLTKTVLTA